MHIYYYFGFLQVEANGKWKTYKAHYCHLEQYTTVILSQTISTRVAYRKRRSVIIQDDRLSTL